MRTLPLASLCCLIAVLTACQPPSPSVSGPMSSTEPSAPPTVRGEVFYLDRRALSDQAELILELTEIDGPFQHQMSVALEGRQVPIAFEMVLPVDQKLTSALQLRAAIVEPGGTVRLGVTESTFTLPDRRDIGTLRLAFPGDEDTDATYVCNEQQLRTLFIGNRLVLVIDGGVALLDPVSAPSGTRYENKRMAFWIEQDGLARLRVDGEEQLPCRRLDAEADSYELAGTRWLLTEILGEPPVADSTPEIAFLAEERRMAGQAGCNRFGGEVIVDGQSLRFGPVMTTLMACPDEAINEQERRLLEALEKVARYELVSGTELRLISDDHEVVLAQKIAE